MSTITFQVDLSTRPGTIYSASSGAPGGINPDVSVTSSYGSWPDLAGGLGSATSNAQFAARSVWLPINDQKDNRQFKHNDIFTVAGKTAYYLKATYGIGAAITTTGYSAPALTGPNAIPGEQQILRIINEMPGTVVVAGGNPGVQIALNTNSPATVVQASTLNNSTATATGTQNVPVSVAQPWVAGANTASNQFTPSVNQNIPDVAPVTIDQTPFNNPAMGHHISEMTGPLASFR